MKPLQRFRCAGKHKAVEKRVNVAQLGESKSDTSKCGYASNAADAAIEIGNAQRISRTNVQFGTCAAQYRAMRGADLAMQKAI